MTDRMRKLEQLAIIAHRDGMNLGQFLDRHAARQQEPQQFSDVAAHIVRLVQIFNPQDAKSRGTY